MKHVLSSIEMTVSRGEQKSVRKEGADSRGSSSSNGSSSEAQEDGGVAEEATDATSYPRAHSGSIACSSTMDDIGDAPFVYEKNEHVCRLASINGPDVATDDLDVEGRDENDEYSSTEKVEDLSIDVDAFARKYKTD